jgi:hypothetical protein
MNPGSRRARLKVVTDGRFLCVELTNVGEPAVFTGIVQPGRGTASAAVARTALWHHSTDSQCRLETGQAATFRVAQRDRPSSAHEDDDRKRVHPEGPQAWRMCFLKKGVAASLDRICAVTRRDPSSEHDDGVVLTVMSEPPFPSGTVVKSISLEGDLAIDLDTGEEFRVLDSPRHYHSKALGA